MIEVKGLTKKYGDHVAVSDLTFAIEDGMVYGFLGPNGAGKSTTMNMITGCLSATDGTVTIDGKDIYDDAVEAKEKIGYLPEIPPLYMEMTPKEYLYFVAEAKKVAKEERKEQIETAMTETGVKAVENRMIKTLSKGYRQRVGIAQAILGEPSIVILDEPTVGLDPKQIIEIRELIKELGKKRTVLLSSHILSEVQAVCNKILIISKGKLVAFDTPENLETLFAGKKTVKLTVKATKDEAADIIGKIEEVKEADIGEAGETVKIEVTCDNDDDICEKLFFAFAEAKKPIVKMNENTASLEDIFIELTSDDVKTEEIIAEDIKTEGEDTESAKIKEEEKADDGDIQA